MEELLLYLFDEVMSCLVLVFGISAPFYVARRVKVNTGIRISVAFLEDFQKINPLLIERYPAIPPRLCTFKIRSCLDGEPDSKALFFFV